MRAIDTNVVVRYLTGDDPDQSARARLLIDGEAVFVCTTVLLETEWVLRSAYGFGPAQVAGALRAFAGLATVTVEEPGIASQALDRMEDGMNFADALHLAKARECTEFVTFDRKFVEAAKRVGGMTVRLA